MQLSQNQLTEYRLDLLEQLHAAGGYTMRLEQLNAGQVRNPIFRQSQTDDVLRELRAMEQAGAVKLDRDPVNRALVVASIQEAGRVLLVDAHRIA